MRNAPMTIDKNVVEQAISALERITASETFFRDPRGDTAGPTIDALRAALASGGAVLCDCTTAISADGLRRTYCSSMQMMRAIAKGEASGAATYRAKRKQLEKENA